MWPAYVVRLACRRPVTAPPRPSTRVGAGAQDLTNMVRIGAGSFQLGSEDEDAIAEDGEGPVRVVEHDAFLIDRTAVSNAEFARFVADTGPPHRRRAVRLVVRLQGLACAGRSEGTTPRQGHARRPLAHRALVDRRWRRVLAATGRPQLRYRAPF